MNEFGEGIVLYFMFLKWLAFQFFMLTLFSLPAFSFFFRSNSAGVEGAEDFTTYVYMFTLGNLGEDYITCDTANFDFAYEGSTQTEYSTINLYCPYGTMESVVNFGLVRIDSTVEDEQEGGHCSFDDDQDTVFSPSSCSITDDNFDETAAFEIVDAF